MIRPLLISITCSLPLLQAEQAQDLLRFTNGDQLHGTYQGIAEGPSLTWQRKDLNELAEFGIPNLRHLVLRNGNPAAPLDSTSVVDLVNGDRIPGIITDLNESEITIETSCAGTITIDRNKVSRVAPQPHGGRLHYHGPFSDERWDTVSYKSEDANELQQALRQQHDFENGQLDDEDIDEDAEEKSDQPDWNHSGAAWYWKSDQPGSALILRDIMPQRSTLRFDLAWKNQLNVAIAFHADFCVEKKFLDAAGDDEADHFGKPQFTPHDSSSLPSIFGNAMVLQIHSNYIVIYRTAVDEDGNKSIDRVQASSSRLRIGENSKSTFEIRGDREQSTYSLFVDGKFIIQWTDPALKNEKMEPVSGNSLAFLPQTDKCQVRISDVIIAEWNGMPDSARSLENEEQDIILMTNGLDRLSGKAMALESGMLRFKGKHGEFMLPMEDISELRFASKDRLKPEPQSGQVMTIRYTPMGRITGTPLSGDRKTMVLRHPLVGELSIQNDAAVMFEFNDTNEIFTNWDDNF